MRSLLSMIAGPPGLMLIAAILGAIGALWASRQQAQFERELRLKSEEIAQLNKKTLDAVTGGDSFCYLSIYPHGEKASLMWNHHGEQACWVRIDFTEESQGLKFDLDRRESVSAWRRERDTTCPIPPPFSPLEPLRSIYS